MPNPFENPITYGAPQNPTGQNGLPGLPGMQGQAKPASPYGVVGEQNNAVPGTGGQGSGATNMTGGQQPLQPGRPQLPTTGPGTPQRPVAEGYHVGRWFIETGPNAGRVYWPGHNPYYKVEGGFNGPGPMQFPGLKDSGSGWARYNDGSYIDYSSPQWKQASAYVPMAQYTQVWQAIPDSWKVDLMNWPPQFMNGWLDAMSRGDSASALKIKQDEANWKKTETQIQSDNARAGAQKRKADYAPGLNITNTPSPYVK